ncbi:MAG TPA: DUF4097 family beta strand repeat-containing protein [Vicinamibacterales bacterium]|nr:DUF4097 family beta strand repeat-containing protein [Vicinamibacterales bacterium]
MTLRLPAAAGLAASVLFGQACVGVNFDHEGHIEREQKRFEVGAAPEVALYTFDGSVEVRSWDRNEVLVEVEKRGQDAEAVGKIQVLSEQSGNRLQVEARRPGGGSTFVGVGVFRSPSARMTASVPRGAHVVVRTGDGAIVAERLDGRLELRTRDGSIRTLETTGDILAESGDGGISIEEASGRVEARTDDGSVRVSGTPGSVRVRSGDGTVVLRIRQGAVMTEDWMVATADGSISVELPDGFNARIEAAPGSGSRVRNDLTLANVEGGTREVRRLRGTLGSGGHLLSLRTSDGTIRLFRY